VSNAVRYHYIDHRSYSEISTGRVPYHAAVSAAAPAWRERCARLGAAWCVFLRTHHVKDGQHTSARPWSVFYALRARRVRRGRRSQWQSSTYATTIERTTPRAAADRAIRRHMLDTDKVKDERAGKTRRPGRRDSVPPLFRSFRHQPSQLCSVL